MANVPESVLRQVRWHIHQLNCANSAILANYVARGPFHAELEAGKQRALFEHSRDFLATFRGLAQRNGVDPESVIAAVADEEAQDCRPLWGATI